MSQPIWKFLANLGDASPLEYGGHFIFIDQTGVYAPEAAYFDAPEDEAGKYIVHRFSLDQCTYIDGILSDNKFHPDKAAWWAKPESERAKRPQDSTYLKNVSDFVGMTVEELVELFISEDPVERAQAYRAVGEYHGWNNLDDYPVEFTLDEMVVKYADALKENRNE